MKDIEKNIKKIVDQQQQTPPSFVWDNIESELHRKRRRGVVILGITLGLIGIIVLFQQISSVSFKNSSKLNAQIQTISAIDQSNKVIASNTNSVNNAEPSTTQATTSPRKKPTNNIAKNQSNSPSITTSQSIIRPHSNTNSYLSKSSIVNQVNKGTDLEIVESKIINIAPKYIKESSTIIPNIFLSGTKPIPTLMSLIQSNKIFMGLVFLDLKNEILKNGIGLLKGQTNLFTEFGVLAGQHLSKVNLINNNRLANIRLETEKEWFTWGTYFHVGFRMKNNIYFGTGVDFIQSKDKFYYKEDGLTAWLNDDTNLNFRAELNTGTLTQSGEIRYTMIDIPFIMGYTKSINGWEMGIEFSSNYNAYFKASGQSLNQFKETVQLDDKTNIYKKRLGLGLSGSFVIGRQLGNGYSWLIKPTFKTYINDISQKTYDLKINYRALYLNTGIIKNF